MKSRALALSILIMAPLGIYATEDTNFETFLSEVATAITPENNVKKMSEKCSHELSLTIPEDISIIYGMGPNAAIDSISALHDPKEKIYSGNLYYRSGHLLGLQPEDAKAVYKLLKKNRHK